jgi:hypothetical protein
MNKMLNILIPYPCTQNPFIYKQKKFIKTALMGTRYAKSSNNERVKLFTHMVILRISDTNK